MGGGGFSTNVEVLRVKKLGKNPKANTRPKENTSPALYCQKKTKPDDPGPGA